MNIAMIHYRVGETDGVSLEMDKWKKILEKNGHQVYYMAGSVGTSQALIIMEMHYRDEYAAVINQELFILQQRFSLQEIRRIIDELSGDIERQFIAFFKEYKIDLVIANNVFSLGRSPHIAVALTNAIKKTGVKAIGHHHDFYWERDMFAQPTSSFVAKLLDTYFPPKDISMKHVVINRQAKHDLYAKKGLESTIVPNVFDFNGDPWTEDEYNHTYKQDMGLHDDQVVFLQATRVVDRKTIELAIDLIATLNKDAYRERLIGKTLYNGKQFTKHTEIILAMVGIHEGGGYEEKLIRYAGERKVHLIVKPELIDHTRHIQNGKKVYALWDAYVHCDMITYPSIYEGWGNQFLEGLFARKPMVVFEYSVFQSDIKPYGFDYISLGDQYERKGNGLVTVKEQILNHAGDEAIAYLTDKEKYEKSVNRNFAIAKKELSLDALERLIANIM